MSAVRSGAGQGAVGKRLVSQGRVRIRLLQSSVDLVSTELPPVSEWTGGVGGPGLTPDRDRSCAAVGIPKIAVYEIESEIHNAYDHAGGAVGLVAGGQQGCYCAGFRDRPIERGLERLRCLQASDERLLAQVLDSRHGNSRRHDQSAIFAGVPDRPTHSDLAKPFPGVPVRDLCDNGHLVLPCRRSGALDGSVQAPGHQPWQSGVQCRWSIRRQDFRFVRR